MSTLSREQLWQSLQEQALVEGELPPIDAAASPWYVRVMLGVAGWIGAMFLLGFVAAGFASILRSGSASLVVGALGCAAAYAILRAAREHDFAVQFGLAVSLAGQSVFIVGLFNLFKYDSAALHLSVLALEVLLAALVPNSLHRLLCSAAAAAALWLALGRVGAQGLTVGLLAAGMALVWLEPRCWLGAGALWRPVGYGLALALVPIQSSQMFGLHGIMFWLKSNGSDWWGRHGAQAGTLLVTLVLLWSVSRLLAQQQLAAGSRAGLAALLAALLLGALSLVAPGLATALLIALLGFACASRVLLGWGLFALLAFVSHYYYQLQTTLLVKSMVLAASGVALLALRLAWHRILPLPAQTEDSHA